MDNTNRDEMGRLAIYNNLPARPAYLKKVVKILAGSPQIKVSVIVKKTKLTKTQVLCTLEELLKRQDVVNKRVGGVLTYDLADEKVTKKYETF